MIVTGDTSTTAEREAGQHKAARRALTAFRLHRVGGRRRAGVPVVAAPIGEHVCEHECIAAGWPATCEHRCDLQPCPIEQAARAERFHSWSVTR